MADTKTEAPADEMREAVARLRDPAHHGEITGDCDNPELLALIQALLKARKPLASWLETAARIAQGHPQDPNYTGVPEFRFCLECRDEETDCIQMVDGALAVARALNGTTSNEGDADVA